MSTIWIFAYVLAVLFANLTLSDFIPLPYFGELSVGTLFFGAVFTLRDRLHQYGLPKVFWAVGLALCVNVIAAWYLDTPPRFIAASFISILVSELTDTAIYQKMLSKRWITRALSSNAISIPLDTFLFSILAFYGMEGELGTWNFILQVVYADLVFKALIATLLAWFFHMRLRKTARKPYS